MWQKQVLLLNVSSLPGDYIPRPCSIQQLFSGDTPAGVLCGPLTILCNICMLLLHNLQIMCIFDFFFNYCSILHTAHLERQLREKVSASTFQVVRAYSMSSGNLKMCLPLHHSSLVQSLHHYQSPIKSAWQVLKPLKNPWGCRMYISPIDIYTLY